jgi:hypothetical protein
VTHRLPVGFAAHDNGYQRFDLIVHGGTSS